MLPITLLLAALLAAQDFEHLQIEPIADGFAGGEGPVWSREGFLLFSDYDANRIYKYIPGKTPELVRDRTERTEIRWTGKGVSTRANTDRGA